MDSVKEYTTLYFICLVGVVLAYLWLILAGFVIREQMRCAEKELMKISTYLKFRANRHEI